MKSKAIRALLTRTPLVTVLLGVSLNGHAQGIVLFQNGNQSRATNFFTGDPVPVGTSFLAGLYYAPDGVTDEESFFQIGLPTGFPFPGLFIGGNRTTPASTPPCGYAMFQVRVWESAFGSTFEEAIMAPPQTGRSALTGKSNIIQVHTGCYAPPFPPIQPIDRFGLAPIYLVPEPPSLHLALGALVAMWVARSRKSR